MSRADKGSSAERDRKARARLAIGRINLKGRMAAKKRDKAKRWF